MLLLKEHLIESYDFVLFTPGIECLDQGVGRLKFVDVSKRQFTRRYCPTGSNESIPSNMTAMEDERVNTDVSDCGGCSFGLCNFKMSMQLCCESSSVESAQGFLLQQELNA